MGRIVHPLRRLGGFGPRMAHAHPPEVLRAGLGALLGLGLIAVLMPIENRIGLPGLALVAPFGASTVLVFAAAASPLAQPWPVIIGNLVSCLVALALLALLPAGPWVAPMAVALAIAAMMALRALHPPGGAVALLAALTRPDFDGPFLPTVLLGSVLLVLTGHLWGRIIRRPYPHAMDASAPPPLGLAPDALIAILEAQEQTANLGADDLAHLIEAAEEAAGASSAGPLNCGAVMVAPPVALAPDDDIQAMAEAFAATELSALPVMVGEGFLGMVSQIELIRALAHQDDAPYAAELAHMPALLPGPDTPLTDLVGPILHRGATALPVLDQGQLLGLVTRTALLSALLRARARDTARA